MSAPAAAVVAPPAAARVAPPAAGLLRPLLWRFRWPLCWVAVFSLFVNLLMLAPTLYMLQVFDRVLISRSEYTLVAASLVLVLFVAMQAVAEWLRAQVLVRVGVRIDDALARSTFDAAFDAQLAAPGPGAAAALADLGMLRQFLTGAGVIALFDLPWALVYVGVLFLMHPWLGALGLLFVLVQAAVAGWGHLWLVPATQRAGSVGMQSQGFLSSKLRNAETVRALGMGGNLRRLWLDLHARHLEAQHAALGRSRQVSAITKFLQYAQQALVLSLGAWLAIRGELTVGALVASNALMASALRPIGALVATWRQLVDARAAHRRLVALRAAYPAAPEGAGAPPLRGQVSLRGLQATAPGRAQPILHGLQADFNAGEVVAVLGPSGAGKSTLARCLVGAWPGAQGQVWLDGRPLSDWPDSDLGLQLGWLAQDVEFFDGTLAENIARFGTVDPAEVVAAAQRCGIHELALRLPQGYDTPLGPSIGQLSGGQRQRVGLARALYGRPRLVVLDEPSANLDDAGVQALAQAITDLRAAGSTVFMVLHQRNLLHLADRVLVLDAGRIAWTGTPQELGGVPTSHPTTASAERP